MQALFCFAMLLGIKFLSRLCFRFDVRWIGSALKQDWDDVRVVAILNHTSLYEPVFTAIVPTRLLWRLAKNGVVPVASKTMERRAVGRFFRFVGGRVVPVSRKRDETWEAAVAHFRDTRSLNVILPEGRMLRRTGLDSNGRPMTIQGGVADLLANVPSGRMLLLYSGGLHHVAAPGDRFPRLFRKIDVRMEVVDIAEYCASLGGTLDTRIFRLRVVRDLTVRRNQNCPLGSGSTRPQWKELNPA